MTDLYLIAHKVSGEPAFDVAQRISCPECPAPDGINYGCIECDSLGYWWIIPTSGHRAYPLMHWELSDLLVGDLRDGYISVTNEAGPLSEHPAWDALPDHYPHSTHTEAPHATLADRLGLTKRQPAAPIVRRL